MAAVSVMTPHSSTRWPALRLAQPQASLGIEASTCFWTVPGPLLFLLPQIPAFKETGFRPNSCSLSSARARAHGPVHQHLCLGLRNPSTPLAAPPVPLTQAQASRRPPPSVALPPTAQPHCLSKAAHEEAKHKHRSARGTAAVDASGTHKDKLARPSQPAPRMASTPLFAGGTSRRLQGETAPPPQTF